MFLQSRRARSNAYASAAFALAAVGLLGGGVAAVVDGVSDQELPRDKNGAVVQKTIRDQHGQTQTVNADARITLGGFGEAAGGVILIIGGLGCVLGSAHKGEKAAYWERS